MLKHIKIILFLYLFLVGINNTANSADSADSKKSSGMDIIEKSESISPGEDQISKLTYIIQNKNRTQRKVVMRRYWKNYRGKNGIVSKIILVHEYPPEQEGTKFMVWTYSPSKGKEDDQWLYIPILGTAHKIENTRKKFEMSDLSSSDMSPRDIDSDIHKFIRTESDSNNTKYYIVESTPKKADPKFTYSKLVKWISADHFLKERIDYYDLNGDLLKKQFIKWKKIGNAMVWEKVLVKNVKTGSKTRIEISDIKVNNGLKDELFTVETLNKGIDALPNKD